MRRVVITGMGTINPLGLDVETTWKAMSAGICGIAPITQFDASEHATKFAGEVKGFDPIGLFGKKEARRLDRVMQLALAASMQAIDDAKLIHDGLNKDKVGVYIGSAVGGIITLLAEHKNFLENGPRRVSPLMVPMILVDSSSARVSIQYGFRGPSISAVSACATGSDSIGEAFEVIARGVADVMITGGAEAGIAPVVVAGFNVMGALSTRNDSPETSCRPFDATRDGFVMSEGAAILILEELEYARRRGARILAEVIGYGSSADAYHITAPQESGEGAMLAMQRAVERGGIKPKEVAYINAHGTGTPLNDPIETTAIKSLFKEHAYKLLVSSTKSMTGHLLGGAGAIEALACVLAIQNNLIPPTINYQVPDPKCDLDYVPNKARPHQVDVALSNSFGFGGHNASILLRRFTN
jgi:3-oxoacyl-[acyl-carrier-protein] synthase II